MGKRPELFEHRKYKPAVLSFLSRDSSARRAGTDTLPHTSPQERKHTQLASLQLGITASVQLNRWETYTTKKKIAFLYVLVLQCVNF